MKSFIRFAMLALVLVIVAMISGLTAMRLAIHGQEVTVPAIVGLAPADAERAVTAQGLQMTIERQYYSAQIPEGRVMSQLPVPGTKVRRGWQVRVAQSLGRTRVTIPDVTGVSTSHRWRRFRTRRYRRTRCWRKALRRTQSSCLSQRSAC